MHTCSTLLNILLGWFAILTIACKCCRFEQHTKQQPAKPFDLNTQNDRWISLDKGHIKSAKKIIRQLADEPAYSERSCGFNSGGRAVLLLGISLDYDQFTHKSRTQPSLSKVIGVGLPPEDLARYINTEGLLHQKYTATYHWYDTFQACSDVIAEDLKQQRPVLIMTSQAWNKIHYENIIGISDDKTEFVTLDTDQQLYRYTKEEIQYNIEDTLGFLSQGFLHGKYNIIRFHKTG